MKYLPALLSIVAFPVMAATGAFTADALLQALIYLVIVGLIAWLIWWFIGYIGLPAPFDKVARVIVGLVVIVLLIQFLLRYI